MPRLPVPGSDDGTWGDILNDFLDVEHNADGSQKDLPQSKVTNLTTDLGGKVSKGMEVYNLRDYANGDGTDEGTAIANALSIAAGKKLIIPHTSTGYKTSIPLPVPAGTTIEFQNHATIIEQTTYGKPVFDCLNADDVKIIGGNFRYTGDRTVPVLPSFRGSAGKVYSAGIWSNGERCIFRDQRAFGFVSGIYLSNWNGTNLTGYKSKNKVEGLMVDTVDWGVLFVGQSDLYFDVRGSYALSPTSTDPAHLVYGSGGSTDAVTDNRNITIGPCEAWDGVGGHAFQVKNTTGGRADSLMARNCPGLFNSLKLVDFTIQSPVAVGDVVADDSGSIILGSGCVRVKVLDPKVDMAVEYRVATLAGTDCEIAGLTTSVIRSTISDAVDVTVSGTRNRLRNTKCINSGAGGDIVISVTSGTDNVVEGVEAVNCKKGVQVASGATNTQVTIDPTRIVPASGAGASSRHIAVLDASTVVRRAAQLTTRTVASGALSNTVIEAPRYDTVFLQVNDTTGFTVPAPIEPASGLTLTFTIFDNSAGMGTVTWNAVYDLRSAWTNPAVSARRTITFRYDGTLWREEFRGNQAEVTSLMAAGTVAGAARNRLKSGAYYTPPGGGAVSALSLVNGNMHAVPFDVERSVTLTAIGVWVTSAGSSGSVVRFGIYSDSPGNGGYPGSLLAECPTTLDATQTTTREVAWSQSFGPGLVWLVCVGQGASAGIPVISGTLATPPNIPSNAMVNATVGGLVATTGVTGALPSTFPAGVNSEAVGARIWIKT